MRKLSRLIRQRQWKDHFRALDRHTLDLAATATEGQSLPLLSSIFCQLRMSFELFLSGMRFFRDGPVPLRLHQVAGNPPTNSFKYFTTLELLEPVKDRIWRAKVPHALNQYWRMKNAAKKNGLTGEPASRILPQSTRP